MNTASKRIEDAFDDVLTAIRSALASLNARRVEAQRAKNWDLDKALRKQADALWDQAIRVRKAEIAYLNSTLPENDALSTLRKAAKDARQEVQRMKELAKALDAANKLLKVVTGVLKLFGV